VGAHLAGEPLNHQLTARGARLVGASRTSPRYRLFALRGTAPPKPGLVHAGGEAGGTSIEVEVWELGEREFGSLVAQVPPPLAIGTVLNGGWHARWEGYALFRDAHIGFAGLALRGLAVPRNRVPVAQTLASGAIVPADSACQATNADIGCIRRYELELQYGVLAGLRPRWVGSMDLLLVRTYTTLGFDDDLFGLHLFRAPFQLLVAYMVDID
jgi:hypothetical protein